MNDIPTVEKLHASFSELAKLTPEHPAWNEINKLMQALESGEVAILSKADRETAILRVVYSEQRGRQGDYEQMRDVRAEARALLQLGERS